MSREAAHNRGVSVTPSGRCGAAIQLPKAEGDLRFRGEGIMCIRVSCESRVFAVRKKGPARGVLVWRASYPSSRNGSSASENAVSIL